MVFLTLPETSYNRNLVHGPTSSLARSQADDKFGEESRKSTEKKGGLHQENERSITVDQESSTPQRESFVRRLRIVHGKFTEESLWKMAYRPVILLALPPVLWATLVMSVTIGFLVAISSNFASAFTTTYGFKAWQSGLCFISGMIGTLLGIFGGGVLSDWVADYFTRRNGGIREPEMRLPAITVALVASPLALVLYGCGIQYQWHWIVPTIGLGLCKSWLKHRFSTAWTNVQ